MRRRIYPLGLTQGKEGQTFLSLVKQIKKIFHIIIQCHEYALRLTELTKVFKAV